MPVETTVKYTLGKNERLKSRKLIEQLFKEGKSFSLFPLRVLYIKTVDPAEKTVRLKAGFTVSTKHFKKATDRNRIRRLMKEAYRLQKNPLQTFLTANNLTLIIFFIYVGKEIPEYPIVYQKVNNVLEKFQSIKGGANK